MLPIDSDSNKKFFCAACNIVKDEIELMRCRVCKAILCAPCLIKEAAGYICPRCRASIDKKWYLKAKGTNNAGRL